MFEKKNSILCNVNSCEYNQNRACTADKVEVTLNNSVVANSSKETACKTFRCKMM